MAGRAGRVFIWQSTSVVVARASVLALFARKAAFLRTPKTSEQVAWWEALRANWAETSLALLGLLGIAAALTKFSELSGPLLAGLLVFPTLGLAAAPFNSWAAQRAALPPALRERRTTEWRRTSDRRAFVRGAALGGVVTVAAVIVAAVTLLLAPSPRPVQPPQLVPPTAGTSTTTVPAPSRSASSPAATPSSSGTSATTAPSSSGPASPSTSSSASSSSSGTASPSPPASTTATPTPP